MAKLSYISDFKENIDLIDFITTLLNQTCEYKDTDEFKMIKDGTVYRFGFNYKGYSVNDSITVREIYLKCKNIANAGETIREIIQEKVNKQLINNM